MSERIVLKKKFMEHAARIDEPQVLVTAVKLPTGAIEVITNTQRIHEKIGYLNNAYDEHFKLIANPEVQIVGIMIV